MAAGRASRHMGHVSSVGAGAGGGGGGERGVRFVKDIVEVVEVVEILCGCGIAGGRGESLRNVGGERRPNSRRCRIVMGGKPPPRSIFLLCCFYPALKISIYSWTRGAMCTRAHWR